MFRLFFLLLLSTSVFSQTIKSDKKSARKPGITVEGMEDLQLPPPPDMAYAICLIHHSSVSALIRSYKNFPPDASLDHLVTEIKKLFPFPETVEIIPSARDSGAGQGDDPGRGSREIEFGFSLKSDGITTPAYRYYKTIEWKNKNEIVKETVKMEDLSCSNSELKKFQGRWKSWLRQGSKKSVSEGSQR